MNNENILYAFIGGLVVALAWMASAFLTLSTVTALLGFFAVVVLGALAVGDYGIRIKKSLR